MKADLLGVVTGGGAGAAVAAAAPAAPRAAASAPPTTAAHAAPAFVRAVAGGAPAPDVTVPLRHLQRAMAKSMTAAWEAPHFGLHEEVTLDAMIALRKV